MKLPRVRFTVLRQMVAVAVVAVGLHAAAIAHYWWRCREPMPDSRGMVPAILSTPAAPPILFLQGDDPIAARVLKLLVWLSFSTAVMVAASVVRGYVRRRPVRFTVRRLMLAVVVVGCVLWSIGLIRISMTHVAKAASSRRCVEEIARFPPSNYPEGYARFFRQLVENYERAAQYPWLPVAPDPPEPE